MCLIYLPISVDCHLRIRTSLKNQGEQIVVLTRPYNWYTWPENSRAHFKILSSDSKQRLKGVNDGLIPAPPSTVQELTLAHTETLAKLKVQPQWSQCTSPALHGQDFISKYEHHALENTRCWQMWLDARQRMLNDAQPAAPPDSTCTPPPHPLHLPVMMNYWRKKISTRYIP